jgi:hypothetical protein
MEEKEVNNKQDKLSSSMMSIVILEQLLVIFTFFSLF